MGSFQPFEFDTSFKALTDSAKDVHTKFSFINEPKGETSDSLPIVDFSALVSDDDPDQRSRTIDVLGQACQQWGFFILVNHGISEALMRSLFEKTREFFDLTADERKQYEAKSASDPIKCGNFKVSDTSNRTFTLWRDYLKMYVHPDFHCPSKPPALREIVQEYSEKTRELARKLIHAITVDFLKLQEPYVSEALNLDSIFQLFATNLYPPCPKPDQAIGLPPHTDHGLLTFLIHNGVAGLQIQHKGTWFEADSPQNSILVNVADQLEIFSNGRCKSVMHRAVLNDHTERVSIVVANGPSSDSVVGPAEPLVEKDGGAVYRSMRYEEYIESQLTKGRVNGKTILEQQVII